MAIVHLVVGFIFLCLFLLTGVYMDSHFPELYGNNEGIRMMYRATHIYILMSALVNLAVGSHYLVIDHVVGKLVQRFASVLIALAPLLFFAGFVYEPRVYDVERTYSLWGVILLLVGVVVHVILGFFCTKQLKPGNVQD